MKKKLSILFLGKKDDMHVKKAIDFCEKNFSEVEVFLGGWGDSLPPQVESWSGDYIISYLSRWIVSSSVLDKARIASLNFHPGPPEYPGYGCNSFALYDGATNYGVTCHHMAPDVDTGAILKVNRFPIYPSDDVSSLLVRSYDYLLVLFYEIMSYVFNGCELPRSSERWSRKPFKREELEKLKEIRPEHSREEIAKRIKSFSYGDNKPYVTIGGFTFELKK